MRQALGAVVENRTQAKQLGFCKIVSSRLKLGPLIEKFLRTRMAILLRKQRTTCENGVFSVKKMPLSCKKWPHLGPKPRKTPSRNNLHMTSVPKQIREASKMKLRCLMVFVEERKQQMPIRLHKNGPSQKKKTYPECHLIQQFSCVFRFTSSSSKTHPHHSRHHPPQNLHCHQHHCDHLLDLRGAGCTDRSGVVMFS